MADDVYPNSSSPHRRRSRLRRKRRPQQDGSHTVPPLSQRPRSPRPDGSRSLSNSRFKSSRRRPLDLNSEQYSRANRSNSNRSSFRSARPSLSRSLAISPSSDQRQSARRRSAQDRSSALGRPRYRSAADVQLPAAQGTAVYRPAQTSRSNTLTPSRARPRFNARSVAPSFMLPQVHHVSPTVIRSRLVMVWGILMLAMLGLLGNLVRLQVFQAAELRQKAQEQHGISLKPFIPRRPIVDRLGNVLAVDQQEYVLYAHPMLFDENTQAYKTQIATQLAPILDNEPGVILEKLNLRDSGIKLTSGLSEEDARQVRALRKDGLDLTPYQDRFYPKERLFSHILGYVNFDREGQVGIEYSQADILSRDVPVLDLKRTGDGTLMPDGVPEDFNYHEHLRLKLTVDSRLQLKIRTLLQEEAARLTADRAIAIVMEVDTGAIRAMVTEPTYDPNALHTEDDIPLMVNAAVSHLYEPGSTFKPINVAIALESGRLNPTDVVHDYGKVTFGTWDIENHDYKEQGARGDLTVSEVLKYSSNIGMIQIMKMLDPVQYYEWLENLGLGGFTGIDLPFESPALVKQRDRFIESSVESATTSFGQGFSLTPIQLLQMLASLGNGGKLVTPHVVDGLFDHDDRRYWTPERPPEQEVFSEETTRIVLDMMETVVNDGTGKAAQIPGYRIAGKTGTAQKAGKHGVYEDGVKVTSFVSLFPAEDPQFALLVVVDEPQGEDTYGGTVAAPIAHDIIEAIITLENIPTPTSVSDERIVN